MPSRGVQALGLGTGSAPHEPIAIRQFNNETQTSGIIYTSGHVKPTYDELPRVGVRVAINSQRHVKLEGNVINHAGVPWILHTMYVLEDTTGRRGL